MVSVDFPYTVLIDIYSNHVSISHCLALITMQNAFCYLLSLGPNFKKLPHVVCEDHWEENSGKVSKYMPAICRKSSVLKFSLHWITC